MVDKHVRWTEKGTAFQAEGAAHANRHTEAEVILLEIQPTFVIQPSMLDGSGEPCPCGVLGWTGDTDWGPDAHSPKSNQGRK